ncbi:response regulator transcription factor [Pseudomonas sp. R5(2019)]|uniref:response regulator transcription factor n=1 Tax=Pseudomonas sp. R5(2019) TaxID=2697566 RepID=UPI00141281B8|nr:response regulator [Pseudomonas sp. R5(2019)]NBA94760.1 response regulator [Pseudomonas sp. R5(2019)]
MPPSTPLVYIVDDDKELRTSLAWLLESVGVRAQCCSGADEFLQQYDPSQPACLVLDVRMPNTSGFQLQDILKARGISIPTLFVSAHGDIPMSVRAMQNGAFTFIEKPYNPQLMLESIQSALRQAEQNHAGSLRRQQLKARLELLTSREREILQLVVDGKASKLIASQLNISVKTVDVHRTKIKEKMGVSSIAMLVRDVISISDDEAPHCDVPSR